MTKCNVTTSGNQYKFATDSESGNIEAVNFRSACEKLEAMIPQSSRNDGAWGWVEDTDGYRYEIGSTN